MIDHPIFVLFLLAFAVVIFLPALIIGSIGAHRLTETRQLQRVYTNTICYVSNMTEESLPYNCNCDGCHPSICYAEHFAVQYRIDNGSQIFGMIHVDEIPYLLPIEINRNYTCFYDRTRVERVQWTMPNERPALAMLIVGFTVAGIMVLVVIIGLIRWLIRQETSLAYPHAQF